MKSLIFAILMTIWGTPAFAMDLSQFALALQLGLEQKGEPIYFVEANSIDAPNVKVFAIIGEAIIDGSGVVTGEPIDFDFREIFFYDKKEYKFHNCYGAVTLWKNSKRVKVDVSECDGTYPDTTIDNVKVPASFKF